MAELTVFDIFSDFAHFKRPYTTTSPVTFPIPSKPTVYGMIGAVIGLDKNNYLERFHDRGVRIGIRIKNPIHKVYIAENLINTKDGMAKITTRTRIKIEFLKNAAYRLYVSHPDEEIAARLRENLKAHKSHYTFSLGLSECVGNFDYVGQFQSVTVDRSPAPDEYTDIHGVLPAEALSPGESPIKFELGKEIFRVSLTAEMNPQREIQRMMDMVFERNGRPISAKVQNYENIPELAENIILY